MAHNLTNAELPENWYSHKYTLPYIIFLPVLFRSFSLARNSITWLKDIPSSHTRITAENPSLSNSERKLCILFLHILQLQLFLQLPGCLPLWFQLFRNFRNQATAIWEFQKACVTHDWELEILENRYLPVFKLRYIWGSQMLHMCNIAVLRLKKRENFCVLADLELGEYQKLLYLCYCCVTTGNL